MYTAKAKEAVDRRAIEQADFDDNMPKYRICCWHIKQWAYFIAVYDIVKAFLAFGLVGGVLIAIGTLLFFFKGIREERKEYIGAYLMTYWTLMGMEAGYFIVHIYFTVVGEDNGFTRDTTVFIVIALIALTTMAFRVWLQIILHKTYHYLSDTTGWEAAGRTHFCHFTAGFTAGPGQSGARH